MSSGFAALISFMFTNEFFYFSFSFGKFQGFGGGCSIGDSGIGSEGCLNARPRSVSDCKALYKQLILGYYTGTVIVIIQVPPFFLKMGRI